MLHTIITPELVVIIATKVRRFFETCKPKTALTKDFANFETFFANFESHLPIIAYFETPICIF